MLDPKYYNGPITDMVLEAWKDVWREPKPIPSAFSAPFNKGRFPKCHVTWERFENGTYHLFLPSGMAAYQTNNAGDPDWITTSQYKDFLDSFSAHAEMVAPDMELDEIHQAQTLMEGMK